MSLTKPPVQLKRFWRQRLSLTKPPVQLKRFWRQRRVLFYACTLVNLIRLALWLFPFKQVRASLATVADRWPGHNDQRFSVAAIVWSVTMASIYTPGGAKCLVQALAAQLLLNRYGHPYQFHIGVAMGPTGTVEAHAWIEYKGHVVMGGLSDLDRFQPFATGGVAL